LSGKPTATVDIKVSEQLHPFEINNMMAEALEIINKEFITQLAKSETKSNIITFPKK